MAAPAADEKKAHAPVQLAVQKTIGLLGGVAWSSSAEYYAFLNAETNKRLGGAHSARVVLLSLDLEPYVNALKAGDFNAVRGFIAKGCAQLQNAGADFLVLCSNTAHIATDHIGRVVPTTPLLHMADCTAAAVKRAGYTKCGFIGTKFAMENASIQLDRLRAHGLEVVTPTDAAARDKLWHVIETELSLNRFTAESKAYFKGVIEQMHKTQGVQCVILGCTEVPLLISQADTPVPLIDTTRVHARTAVDVSLGLESIDALLPPALAAEKAELLKPKKKKAAAASGVGVAAATGQAVAAAPAAAPAPAPAPAK